MFDVDFEHKYRYLLRSVSVFIALILCFAIVLINTEFRAGLFDRPNKEDYDLLTSYADKYARTLDKSGIVNENIEITTSYIREESIVITIQEMRCKVEAVYPMSITVIEEGEFDVKIFYDKGVYLASSNLNTIIEYIIIVIISIIFFTFLIYIIICGVCYCIRKKRKK